mmetsp:Transcript_56380/g.127911  ORF Transcript_56380/g.127911 Transcript_56380/m.127911 type:complete len:447 (-) Transcript_56380:1322-2662(-)
MGAGLEGQRAGERAKGGHLRFALAQPAARVGQGVGRTCLQRRAVFVHGAVQGRRRRPVLGRRGAEAERCGADEAPAQAHWGGLVDPGPLPAACRGAACVQGGFKGSVCPGGEQDGAKLEGRVELRLLVEAHGFGLGLAHARVRVRDQPRQQAVEAPCVRHGQVLRRRARPLPPARGQGGAPAVPPTRGPQGGGGGRPCREAVDRARKGLLLRMARARLDPFRAPEQPRGLELGHLSPGASGAGVVREVEQVDQALWPRFLLGLSPGTGGRVVGQRRAKLRRKRAQKHPRGNSRLVVGKTGWVKGSLPCAARSLDASEGTRPPPAQRIDRGGGDHGRGGEERRGRLRGTLSVHRLESRRSRPCLDLIQPGALPPRGGVPALGTQLEVVRGHVHLGRGRRAAGGAVLLEVAERVVRAEEEPRAAVVGPRRACLCVVRPDDVARVAEVL